MSKHCALDIKNLGTNRVQIKLYGDGKPVSSNKESLVDNWPLSFGRLGRQRNRLAGDHPAAQAGRREVIGHRWW